MASLEVIWPMVYNRTGRRGICNRKGQNWLAEFSGDLFEGNGVIIGYFSNGSEGLDYQEQWCFRCVNWPDDENTNCPVWAMHNLYNYEQCGKTGKSKLTKRFLEMFIPRDKNSNNEKCLMFRQRKGELYGQEHINFPP